tara:strand:- start:4964 stop:5656 length:693 start_codon:yes stop_codon:yes gene_type:complete
LLSQSRIVKRWSFQHDPDEACTVEIVHDLLRETITKSNHRPHIVAHGISGTIAYLFAEKHPDLISSLTVLAVDTVSSNHWSSHYHIMRSQLPCSRNQILEHFTSLLFDVKEKRLYVALAKLLAQCLDSDFVISSLFSNALSGALKKTAVPTFVINGDNDIVVDRNAKTRWEKVLKPGDRYESIQGMRHFFHFNQPISVAEKISNFLDMIPTHDIPDQAPTHIHSLHQTNS